MADDMKQTFPKCPVPGYAIRPAVDSDLDFIFELDRLHMKPEVDKYYPGNWNDAHAMTIIRDNLSRARVVEFNGARVAACYWWIEDHATAVLHSIQVAGSHRRKGLGRWLVQCFEAEARVAGLAKAALARNFTRQRGRVKYPG